MALQQVAPPTGSISLATLIDHVNQKTYHDLTVLSELLPRKTDMERKMEIVQFADRTHQLAVRLLAVVKWAKSAGKIDTCMHISNILDKQSMMFVDTADQLSLIARDTLMQARLPSFSIPTAVDVLTTGTYSRLPSCIRDKIIAPDPITEEEKTDTLKQLTRAIENRLVVGEVPKAFSTIDIGDGRVRLTAKHEFSVDVALSGDGPTIPWKLLELDILVEDAETCESSSLVHPIQVNYILELIQSRIMDSEGQTIENPLRELYDVAHSFCLSLQLEVLFNQAQRQVYELLDETIAIDKYIPSTFLTISYWRDSSPSRNQKTSIPGLFKLTVSAHPTDSSRPLRVEHSPPLEISGALSSIESAQVSLANLLVETRHSRSKTALRELQKGLEQEDCGVDFKIVDLPPMLTFAVLHPSMKSERVQVCVDYKHGKFKVSMPQYDECPCAEKVQAALGSLTSFSANYSAVGDLLRDCRLWLALQRCKKSMQYSQAAQYFEHLPLVESQSRIADELNSLSRYRLYIRLPHHESLYMVVSISSESTLVRACSVKYHYYLLTTTPQPFDLADLGDTQVPHWLLKPEDLTRLDSGALRGNVLDSLLEDEIEETSTLARALQARADSSCYFVGQLLHVINICKERAAFGSLSNELWNRGVAHQGVQLDDTEACHSLSILCYPPSESSAGSSSSRTAALFCDGELFRSLKSCTFRVMTRDNDWIVQYLFTGSSVLRAVDPSGDGAMQVISRYETKGSKEAPRTVDLFLDEWESMLKLYEKVAEYMHWRQEHHQAVVIALYDVKRIVFHYGPSHEYMVSIQYVTRRGRDEDDKKRTFVPSFGMVRASSGTTNPHLLTTGSLQKEFTSLQQFLQVVVATAEPLVAIKKISTNILFGLSQKTMLTPECNILVIVTTSNFIRLLYRKTYCVDVKIQPGGLVSIRDGACSVFDGIRPVDNAAPLPLFKEFLNLFVDSTDVLRPLQSLGDDIMSASPMAMDQTAGDMAASPAPGYSPLELPNLMSRSPLGPPVGAQSPATLISPSPGSNLPAPSPGYRMSPAGFVSPGQVGEGSPFTGPSSNQPGVAPSPAGPRGIWPASPSLGPGQSPHPGGQVLSPQQQQQKAYQAAAGKREQQRGGEAGLPTVLTCDAFLSLVSRPSRTPGDGGLPMSHTYSPLESYLGASFLLRNVSKAGPENISMVEYVPNPTVGTGSFKSQCFVCNFSLLVETQPSLQLTLTPTPEMADRFKEEDIKLLQDYFLIKVGCPPYKANAVNAFRVLLSASWEMITECVALLRAEMFPDRTARWSLQWCWTMPKNTAALDAGIPGILLKTSNNKFFFVVKLTPIPGGGVESRTTPNSHPVTIPFLVDTSKGTMEVARHALPQLNPVNDIIKSAQERGSPFSPSISAVVKEVLHKYSS